MNIEYVVATIDVKKLKLLLNKIKLRNSGTNHAERLSVHVGVTLKR